MPFAVGRRVIRFANFLYVGSVLVVSSVVSAAPYVTLGPSDGVALDQPRVAVAVVDPTTGNTLGPELSNTFLLDTGASGILIGANAYGELVDQNYQTVANYDEVGVGGTATMRVSKPYEFNFAGDDFEPLPLPNMRILSNEDADFGFDGVVGMPAMVNRVTTIDMSVWSQGADTLSTTFSNFAPAVVTAQYHVPLTLHDFPPSGQQHPNDPVPTFAPLPMAPVQLDNHGHTFQGNFIVDTGAQISIISSATAAALGINPATQYVDQLDLSGIAGTVTVPIVDVGSLALKTTEGVNLQWTGLQVGVYDIDDSIAGIFGMDFLTSGWLEALFGGSDGYLNKVHFDFRNAASHAGTMVLDLNPALNKVVVPGDANHDRVVNAADIAQIGSHWLKSGAGMSGDVTGDGVVNAQDVALVGSNWLSHAPQAAAAVPEPASGTIALLASGVIGMVAVARRVPRQSRGS